ncbi:hypothetical protein ES332_D02G198900v1 [Gossypium tomentosum]|uniref:Amine oxidase n=1 Tax=Gossypium tomentosum TaxID=34277 RepID=A0A5D2LZD9_GOSTO|nr:hypothetical protein ES332_D02G198900v1 [Gossypium tomentosum]
MQNMVVIEFEDRKLVPFPPADPLRNYTAGETRGGVDRSDVKPLQIIQPEGPSFRVSGNFVEWQKGLVIYSVAYVDGSHGRRPIAHRLSFVEMVVPYGDPNEPHYRKNAFDAGEDGLGIFGYISACSIFTGIGNDMFVEIPLIKALVSIGKDDGIKGYWKGNLPQIVLMLIACPLMELVKLFTGKDGELSVLERLAAGACAGMTSTFLIRLMKIWANGVLCSCHSG